MNKIREIWPNITHNGHCIDSQVEIDAHYSGYLLRQSHDIASFKRDEGILIPDGIKYGSLSGLSNEVKSR